MSPLFMLSFFFFFNDTATTEIYTLSLHDALPISQPGNTIPGSSTSGEVIKEHGEASHFSPAAAPTLRRPGLPVSAPKPFARIDRKSTRLNSSHLGISYAVFCLKKKKTQRHSAAVP